MKWFDKLSYLRKLTLASMLSSFFAILAVLLIIGSVSYKASRNYLLDNLNVTANIVGTSARTAIIFGDQNFALEILSSLKNRPDIIEAKLFTLNQDTALAEYQNSQFVGQASATEFGFLPDPQVLFTNRSGIYISQPILLNDQVVGSIALHNSLQPLYSRLKFIALICLITLFVAGLVSFLVWQLSKAVWAEPLLLFSRTIRSVTRERDYSKRLRVSSDDELGELISGFNAMLEQIETQQFQLLEQQSGLEQEVKVRTHELTNANQKLLNVVAERAKAEITLLKLTSAVTQADDSVIITDNEGTIEYVNPSFERVTGYSAEHAVGQKTSFLKSDLQESDFFTDMWASLSRGEVFKGVFINALPNGEVYHLEQSITAVRNAQEEITNYVATGRDITERIQAEANLQHMAHHDSLTGLPNRSLLMDRIDHAIERARRENNEIAVMFIDLDGFKLANDTHGHEAGDLVLKAVADRLRSAIRTQDTVARISGDEFVVVLEDLHDASDSGVVARKLMHSLCNAYHVAETEVFVTASIGIAVFPLDAEDEHSLLKYADQAMYTAKKNGKAQYSFYSDAENDSDTQRMQIEQQLIRAVKENQFVLYYQPIMQADESGVRGLEALIRWQHPLQGIVLPDQFIPLLEDSGMINEVGAWVMQEACLKLAAWQAQGGHSDLVMSINVSPRQLNDDQFINYLTSALQASAIQPESLEIEITERMFLDFNELNVGTLNRVSDLGVRIAVDDFGMGHSSLSYLSKLRVDSLKIDRSFIHELSSNDGDAKIVSALIGLAERLKISVTAEGVETREQLKMLADLHCNYVQGYLWAPAMPPDEFEKWDINTPRILKILPFDSLSMK